MSVDNLEIRPPKPIISKLDYGMSKLADGALSLVKNGENTLGRMRRIFEETRREPSSLSPRTEVK